MLKQRILALTAGLALLAAPGLAAQSGAPAEAPPPAQPRAYPGPHVTGTVVFWNGNRMELKTRDGKEQRVAVNERTERLVEIEKGAEVTVDYSRKVGGFVIARRVRAVEETPATAQPSAQETRSVTGEVVSANQAQLVLRTDSEEVAFFLSPSTEHLVRPLGQGRRVTVEYREVAGGSKMAVRVSAAGAVEPGPAPGSGGQASGEASSPFTFDPRAGRSR